MIARDMTPVIGLCVSVTFTGGSSDMRMCKQQVSVLSQCGLLLMLKRQDASLVAAAAAAGRVRRMLSPCGNQRDADLLAHGNVWRRTFWHFPSLNLACLQ
jgi:hypothetical protein